MRDSKLPQAPGQQTNGIVSKKREVLDTVVVRFAGDSGDGMQTAGAQFGIEAALAGKDISTFPDFPAEIRAPAGTTYGVSAFQVHFGSQDVKTAGDEIDVLVAMNPAALKVNVDNLGPGGTIVVDTGAFTERNLKKAGYETNPLEDNSLAPFVLIPLDMTTLTLRAVESFELSKKDATRCRNMWALGLALWMFDGDKQATIEWVEAKFGGRGNIADANIAAINAGNAFGETAEMPSVAAGWTVNPAELEPGLYRTVSGTEALAWGLTSGLASAGLKRMIFASYPITPASNLLHSLARMRDYGVVTFQAEDEIAAACAAIGASYGGALGVTSSSGPGIALKGEAIGLAVGIEIPLIVVNSQRAGPSTGMPTKTEQSDLYQALYGRNGDAPVAVLAPATPTDCFEVGREAVRIATQFMTPVFILTDGYLSSAAEPWRIPDVDNLPDFPVVFRTDPTDYHPFVRNPETLARPWVRPGTPGLEHRIGGLERSADTSDISYDPENHDRMTRMRAERIERIAQHIPEQTVDAGDQSGPLAVVGWGSTYGAISKAVERVRSEGKAVSHIHLRWLSPFPRNLADLLAGFERVLVPEVNAGQLVHVLQFKLGVPAEGLNRVTGRPFRIREIEAAISTALEETS
jgi:2-oxoglutarate ferredoxin oxidoreductase subunit alpha